MTVTQQIESQGFFKTQVEGREITLYKRFDDSFEAYDSDGYQIGEGDTPGGAMLAAMCAIRGILGVEEEEEA